MSVDVFLLDVIFLLGFSSAKLIIDNQPLTKWLNEKSQTKALLTIECSDDSANIGNYAISKKEQDPSSCDKCFQVVKDHNGCSGYCLWYHADVGTLDYKTVNLYTITVQCDDAIKTPATAPITINITPNRQPFIRNSSLTCQDAISSSTQAGSQVFSDNPLDDAHIVEYDGDPIYYSLTVAPSSVAEFFTIGETDGVIRATKDLSKVCIPSLSFSVTITDRITNPPRTIVISCPVTGYHKSPVITSNVNREVQLPEDTPLNTLIGGEFDLTNTDPAYSLDISTSPASAIALVTADTTHVKVASKLNYESTNRNFNVTIRPNNGWCEPNEYWLFVRITDKNDPPVLAPKTDNFAVYERTSLASDPTVPSIEINWGPLVTDEDYDDLTGSHTFSIVQGNDAKLWKIDRTTGVIQSNGIYDVDADGAPTTAKLLVQVKDAEGGIDNATINIKIEDFNDNRPIIDPASYTYDITDCTPTGLLGTMVATDADLVDPNNQFEFDFTTSAYVTVDKTGAITLTELMPAGKSVTLSVGATDKGTPTTLSSLTKATIVVSSTACPTTPTPPTVPTVKVTTKPDSSSSNNNVNNVVSNGINSFPNVSATGPGNSAIANSGTMMWIILAGLLGALLLGLLVRSGTMMWIILAGLLGALLLGLLAYMLSTYCYPHCQRGGCSHLCQQRQPTPQVRPVEVKEKPPTPETKPEPEPYIYDFWKEKEPTTHWVYTGTSLEYEASGVASYGNTGYATSARPAMI